MFHGLTSEILYCVSKICSTFRDDQGNEVKKEGTAFSLLAGEKQVLVSNAHLFDLNYGRSDTKYIRFKWVESHLDSLGKDAAGLPTRQLRFVVPGTHNTVLRHQNPLNDVAALVNPQVGNLDGTTDRPSDYCIQYGDVATAQEIERELLPFDLVAFPGFPPWHSQDGPRAIVRAGTVASDPRFKYTNSRVENIDVVLYEAMSFGGSSGSPVLAVPKVPSQGVDPNPANKFRRFLLVGVNAGHLNTGAGAHTGLSYFVKSSVIRDIVDPHV